MVRNITSSTFTPVESIQPPPYSTRAAGAEGASACSGQNASPVSPAEQWNMINDALNDLISKKKVTLGTLMQDAGQQVLSLQIIRNRGQGVTSCAQALTVLERLVAAIPETDPAYRGVREHLVQTLSMHYQDIGLQGDKERIFKLLRDFMAYEQRPLADEAMGRIADDRDFYNVISAQAKARTLINLLEAGMVDNEPGHPVSQARYLLRNADACALDSEHWDLLNDALVCALNKLKNDARQALARANAMR